ncbi:MAG: protein kinase [Bacteroidota bacterium]
MIRLMNREWNKIGFPYDELRERYELLGKVGEGAGGLVYKAIHRSTDQLVAIKVLKENYLATTERLLQQKARFERETRLCAEINHPHIVRLLDKGISANHIPFAVFEFVSGTTLKDLIVENQGLKPPLAGQIMRQVMEALVFAHSKGIAHRDLKPHNIMVSRQGAGIDVKVLDFGIGALISDRQHLDHQYLTLPDEVIGTPPYSAPEQLRGEPPTVKSDIYAWGLIFLECLTAQPVVNGHSVAEVIEQQLSDIDVQIPLYLQGHQLADLLKGVLAKRTDRRYADGMQIIQALAGMDFDTIQPAIAPLPKVNSVCSTQVNRLVWNPQPPGSREAILLCCRVEIRSDSIPKNEQETLQSVYDERMTFCRQIASQFGGVFCSSMAGYVLFSFPQMNRESAGKAGGAAWQIIRTMKEKDRHWFAQTGMQVLTSAVLHGGVVSSQLSAISASPVAAASMTLLQQTTSHEVYVSDTVADLLAPSFKLTIPAGKLESVFGIAQVYEVRDFSHAKSQ